MSAIVQSLDYGNGLDLANTYTQDYELAVRDGLTPVIERDHARSDNVNLTGITDAVVAANSQTLGYTATNRLQSADGPWGDLDYTYDGVGNRLTRVLDDGTITTQTFGYPSLSNLIGDEDTGGVTTYDYAISHAGRISQVKINSVVSADYEYNARNQLVFRSTTVAGGPAGDMHYVYDRSGQLIAEADAATGTTVREYVWLADMPIAVVADVDTASPVIYYVHADHLNRPVMMTDGLKANVWEAVWLPYGAAYSITGAAANDARFPGQWFQIETGLHYNWHRHYDPTLARYTQADPLGFVDGPSVFAYAKNSPQKFIDPDGRVGIFPQWNWPWIKSPEANSCPVPPGTLFNERGGTPSLPGAKVDCHKRFEVEQAKCFYRGRRFIRACINRAEARRNRCLQLGGKVRPEDEPPEWNADDEEEYFNPDK